jgi:hypothetical protein
MLFGDRYATPIATRTDTGIGYDNEDSYCHSHRSRIHNLLYIKLCIALIIAQATCTHSLLAQKMSHRASPFAAIGAGWRGRITICRLFCRCLVRIMPALPAHFPQRQPLYSFASSGLFVTAGIFVTESPRVYFSAT